MQCVEVIHIEIFKLKLDLCPLKLGNVNLNKVEYRNSRPIRRTFFPKNVT